MAKTIKDLNSLVYDLHEFDINVNTREIYLHRHIHDESEGEGDCGVDYRMAVRFIKNLRFLDGQNHNDIIIYMQSRGGDWNDGMAIYDAIKGCNSYVTIIAYAHARSMTSIILQAADERVLMPNCDVLIHWGWLTMGDDRVTPAMSAMEHSKRCDQRMLDIYVKRCKKAKIFKGKTKQQVERFIRTKMQEKTDWIMTAEEAVRYGFADRVAK